MPIISSRPSRHFSIEEVKIEGTTKDEIYDQVMFWFAKKLGDTIQFAGVPKDELDHTI